MANPWCLWAVLVAAPLASQAAELPVQGGVEALAFDRPEAWAMKYFTAVVLPTGMGVPARTSLGAARLGVEAGWIPALGAEERRVGFGGAKEEDLNKLPAYGRLRLAVGLPWQLTADATWAPPVEVEGAVAQPFSLGIGRPLLEAGGFRLGARAYAGRVRARGSFTCAAAAPPVAAGDTSAGDGGAAHDEPGADMSDCLAPSHDVFHSRYAGLELGAAQRLARLGGLEAYLTASASYADLAFQVNAQLMTHVDRRRLETDGFLFLFASGLRLPLADRVGIVAEAAYAPLTVRRPGEDRTVDGVLNVRGLVEVVF